MPSPSSHPPGFKEWSFVCDALGSGAQSIILRKGGIHEGRGGFWWRHDRFFLFPTHFHEQSTQFLWTPSPSSKARAGAAEPESHTIEYVAEVESKHQITDWNTVRRLAGLHFWTEETLRERFDYSEATGISLAFVRVFRLSAPWTFPDEKKFGGCRSWLDLPPPQETLVPSAVLNDATHAARRSSLEEVMGKATVPEGS